MPYLDRDSFIALLEQLGSDNDREVLAAARELDARVRAAGVGWTDLLTPEGDDDDQDFGDDDDYDDYEDDEDDAADGDRDDADLDGTDRDDGDRDDADLDGPDLDGADPGDADSDVPAEPKRRPGAASADSQDSAELIDQLLGEFDLSAETRQDLLDLKQDIAAGEFTAMDRRYLDALRARLTKG